MSLPIRDWLETAFTEKVDSIDESYFFDRRDNEFYAVFISDYFLIAHPANNPHPGSPYSQAEWHLLSERIHRQEHKDPSIVYIPRLTVKERKEMMQAFLDNESPCDKEALHNIADYEDGRTGLDFRNRLPPETKEKWHLFKTAFIQKRVDLFCRLQNIDLTTASLWTEKKMTSMALNSAAAEENKERSKPVKPWWKFW